MSIKVKQLAEYAKMFGKNPKIKANATISYATSSGETVSFDEIGNPIIIQGEPETETIECYLWRPMDEKIKNQKNEIGLDKSSNYYIGRLVEPKTYNFPIRSVGDITVTINGRQGRLIDVVVLETSTSISAGLPSNLGQKIECYIEFKEGN